MKKQLTAVLLCFLLILSVMTSALGVDVKASGTKEITYINPLYQDVIDESDLNQPSELGIAPASEEEYYDNISEAGNDMRSHLVGREETITIQYQAEEYSSELVKGIVADAMKHTGNPKEGDYLRWQYAGWKSSTSYYRSDNICYMTITYTMTYYTTSEQEEALNQKMDSVLNQLNIENTSNYKKIQAVYDYICDNVVYDYDNLEDDEYKLKYTAYAALMDGTAVCQGYAILFYRMALELNIDARVITGVGNGGPHGWNIVDLKNQYYNLDATWDAGRSSYRYFLKCNENFGDHTRDEEYTTDEFQKSYPMASKDYEDLPMITITKQPVDYTGKAGDIAEFVVEAEGTDLLYQWQFSSDGGTTWKNSSQNGNKTATLKVPVTEARDGQQYRCVIKDAEDEQVISDVAVLIVEAEALAIVGQPSDYTGGVGDIAQFTVEAVGKGLSYQWQFSSDNGTTWKSSSQSGNRTKTISVPITEARNGQLYRCMVKDAEGNQIISEAAALVVEAETLVISSQPKDYTGVVGDTASFTVKATGNSLKYQWQYSNNKGETWKNSSQSGSRTATVNVPITEARDGQQYRCVVTDKNGNSVTSEAAKLIVGTELIITSQPEDYTGVVGDTAVFTIQAVGDGLKYQWQFSNDDGKTWRNSSQSGCRTATVDVPITEARDGQQYRCVVTDKNGNSMTSEVAKLFVKTEMVRNL